MVQSCINGKGDDILPPTHGIHTEGGNKKDGPNEHGNPLSSSNGDDLIHGLEWNAYYTLLKAFTAQSKSFTLERERLMINVRKELKIADEEYLHMLERVGDDEALARVLTPTHSRKIPSMPPLSPLFQDRKKQNVSHVSPCPPLLKPPNHPAIVTSTSNGQKLPMQRMYSNEFVLDAIKFHGKNKGASRSNIGTRSGRVGGQAPGSYLKSVNPSPDESLQGPSTLHSKLGKREAFLEMDNNGIQVKYPKVAKFVEEINALEHERDVEKLQSAKRMVKEYEEMLKKALCTVTNFSIDGERKEDDSIEDGHSNNEFDSSGDGDYSEGSDSILDDDSSEGKDSSEDEGSKVNR